MTPADIRQFERYRAGYSRLWAGVQIRPERRRDVDATVDRILAARPSYDAIERKTGCPWWMVAIIHKMEANLDFTKHLHNGDSLNARTWQVPAGRPKEGSPPFRWYDSAVDAIRYDGLDGEYEWSVEMAAFALEKFNGFGYQRRGIANPYLWSFTNNYARGKFVRDGVFDADAVSEQSGAMAILKVLVDRGAVWIASDGVAPVPANENEVLPKIHPRPLLASKTLVGVLMMAAGAVYNWALHVVTIVGGWGVDIATFLAEVAEQAGDLFSPASAVIEMVGLSLPWLGLAAVAIGLLIAVTARINAHIEGKIG